MMKTNRISRYVRNGLEIDLSCVKEQKVHNLVDFGLAERLEEEHNQLDDSANTCDSR